MPSYAVYIVTFLLAVVIACNWVLPLLARTFIRCRLTYLSLSRARGFEWRHASNETAIIPDVRIEQVTWRMGGWRRAEGVGLLVIHAQGLSVRQRNRPPQPKAPPGRLSTAVRSMGLRTFIKNAVILGLSLASHHYPSMAGLVSIEITDGRTIFDDLDGLELTWSRATMGARINFHRDHGSDGVECTGTDEVDPASALSPPTSPILDSPLASNGLHFAFPPSTRRPNKSGPSRFREARRKASVVSSRVTSSAARVWYRFIGRAHGNVVFTSTISDMAVILPHSNPAHPQSMSRPSIHDLKPQPHPQCSPNSGPHHRDSAKSLEAEKVKSTYSMERLFRRIPRYALPSHEGGYERLLALDGESRMVVSVKFGPRRGLLTEDTLSVETNLGCLHTCIGAWGKVQDLMKTYKEKKERKDHRSDEKSNGGDGAEGGRHETAELPQIPHGPRNPWDRSSLPRVSTWHSSDAD